MLSVLSVFSVSKLRKEKHREHRDYRGGGVVSCWVASRGFVVLPDSTALLA